MSTAETAKALLGRMSTAGRRPHAVLIDGGSETERAELAAYVAKLYVCDGRGEQPCCACDQCRKADEGVHPDIVPVTKPDDRKSFAKADVKRVVEEATLTPNEAAVKVFVLNELQLMSEECQNVLLKILEEPPAYTAFVLTAQTANAVIPTVLSRVVRLRLGSEEETEFSDKAIAVVQAIAAALQKNYEYDRVAAVAPLDGNKPLTAEVLLALTYLFRDAAALKLGGSAACPSLANESRALAALPLETLLARQDFVGGLLRSLDNNPNYTLLSAVLSAGL